MTDPRIGQGRTVLITGASSGIGAALAGCFARAGFDLVLVARSADKLRALAKDLAQAHQVRAWVAVADLAQAGSAQKLGAAMRRARRGIDILVNNAGVLEHGAFIDIPAARHQELIDLNVSGLTAMLAQFLPAMRERGSGRILNVASIAAFGPIPSLASYAATKAYVLSLTESLSEELQDSGVSISALCPGITATNMLNAVKSNRSHLSRLPGFLISDVDQVAQEGFDACMAGEVVRVPGALNLAGMLAARIAPKWLVRRLSGVLGRKSI